MLHPALPAYAFNLAFCEKQCADLDDSTILKRPTPSLHIPAWILGHLAVATDWAGKFLGFERRCPASWHRTFGRGSSGELDFAPTKNELLDAIRDGHARVIDSIRRGVDPAHLAQPHAIPHLATTPLQTFGDVVLHLMTNHESMHLGQLSMCRRSLGLPGAI